MANVFHDVKEMFLKKNAQPKALYYRGNYSGYNGFDTVLSQKLFEFLFSFSVCVVCFFN